MSWKHKASARISHMTPEQARVIIALINSRGPTIYHPEILDLTGGFASQNINFYVMRRLGVKAGFIKEQS